ncbi:MAG: exonuclease domain-containing protein, partial [Chloroflexota bacterium]|nr:exonuclease domain-containing protein [Chloroflexota bacterium]
LDLEMTGQDYDRDHIIQIAAIRFDAHRVLDRWHTLINPGVSVPLKIARLTGIRGHDLQYAPRLEQVQDGLARFVGDAPLIGHSIDHDVRFLERKGVYLRNPQIDTWELATLLMPSLSGYSLSGVAAALKIPTPRAHDALADAEVSRQVFLALLARLHEVPAELVAEIARLTEGTGWGLHELFSSLAAPRHKPIAVGAPAGSIRAQLLAKGLTERELTGVLYQPAQRVSPLEPAVERTALDPDALAELFGPAGALARTFPGYELRPQQVEMMRAVVEAFNGEDILLVEAGTGTGKSLAYLLPAARWALQNGERVVISTDTINLQDQLYNKDIPDVRRVLGRPGAELKTSLVKGRSNYLCLTRWEAFRREPVHTPDEVRFIAKVLLWLPSTLTGDVAELPLTQDERVHWSKVCATRETCTGRRCQTPNGKQCFLYRARQEAEGAHLVLVNHSLLLSDIAADNTVLPEYRYLVLDEAHRLEEQATEQFGFSLDLDGLHGHLDRISRVVSADRHEGIASLLPTYLRGSRVQTEPANRVLELTRELAERTDRVRARADEFFARLVALMGRSSDSGSYDRHLRLTAEQRTGEAWERVELAWDNLKVVLTDLQASLQTANELFESFEGLNVLQWDEVVTELQSLRSFNSEVLQRASWIVSDPREQDVVWVTLSHRTGTTAVRQAPLHVGSMLHEHLYTTKSSIVLTSATLSTDRNFEYVKERLGLESPQELLVGSPFDYRSSTLMLLATDMPEPGTQGYQKAVEAALIDLALAAEGRTLVLFTSHSAVQATLRGIQRPLAQRDILVLAHGDGSRHRLLEQFKSNPRTVLLGTRSFWEGVDVVGDALSLLVITKLPFEVPTDPVFAARSESFAQPFEQYAIPQAILRLKQGFGRLIRSQQDRGAVVMLDRRVVTKSYGRMFLRSLPPASIRQGPARLLPREVEQWLAPAGSSGVSASLPAARAPGRR